jgi:hypothetical protein
MEPAFIQLVEENQPSISYQEQIPEHSGILSLESVNVSKDKSFEEPLTRNLEQAPIPLRINSIEKDAQDSNSDEIQAVSEKSKKTEPNVEKVRFIISIKIAKKMILIKNLNYKKKSTNKGCIKTKKKTKQFVAIFTNSNTRTKITHIIIAIDK